MKNYNSKCPFCGGEIKVIVCDDEGNLKFGSIAAEYEQNPWSGLRYQLYHTEKMVPEGVECPISTEEGYSLGCYSYDSKDDALAAANLRK